MRCEKFYKPLVKKYEQYIENANIELKKITICEMRYLPLLWFMIFKYRVSNSKKNERY
jgi:hypothetical protein